MTGGLLVARVDRQRERLDEALPQALLLGDELRVLDRDRRRRAERGEEVLVGDRERTTAMFVHDLEDTDDAATVALHREREQALRVVPGEPVGLRVETRVVVGVGDVDRLSRLGDAAGDPDADGKADLARAERDARPELAPVAVDDEDRRAIRGEECSGRLGHLMEQGVEVGDGHELARDVEDDVQALAGAAAIGPLASLRVAALGGAPLAHAALALALFAHVTEIFSSIGPTVSATCSRSI